MKKTVLINLCLMALPLSAVSQWLSLSHDGGGPLWVDPNRLYDYNQYEKSRWGLGLRWGWDASEIDTTRYGWDRLSLAAYTAYGYADQRFKWGVEASLWGNPKLNEQFYINFFHDLTPDASRAISTPSLNILTAPSSLMTRLFSDTYRLTFGHTRKVTKKLTESLEFHLSRERQLYGNGNPYIATPIYPTYSELNDMKAYDFAELLLYLSHSSGWSGKVEFGVFKTTSLSAQTFLRTLVQYDRRFPFSFLSLQVFGQGGIVNGSAKIPYSRRFDLGGTWSSPLLLNHSLLTVRPNEFTAMLFSMVNLKLTTTDPLFEFYNNMLAIGTSPHPFLLANAAWGASFDGIIYHAPSEGIAEVGAGIDGILVWGMVNWGFGVVYQLTPESAPYHLPDPKDNLTFLFTASLNL